MITPATPRQLWALFCATKKDHRDMNLSKHAASELIKELNENRKSSNLDVSKKILEDAFKAGNKALEECTPRPMVVCQHQDPLNDSSAITHQWHVPDGVCGFAWVVISRITESNKKFIADLKKLGLCADNKNPNRDAPIQPRTRGYSYWVSEGNQSMGKKEAFAKGMCAELEKHNIDCHWGSNID